MNVVLPTPLDPLPRSFTTNSKVQAGRAPQPAHGSCALVKEVDNARFVDLVADGEHMVAVRDVEYPCAGNKRGQSRPRSSQWVLRTNGNQNGRAYCTNLGARQSLPRSANTGSERAQVGLRLLCKCTKHTASGILDIIEGWRLEGLGYAFRQTDAFDEMDAKSPEYRGAHPLR